MSTASTRNKGNKLRRVGPAHWHVVWDDYCGGWDWDPLCSTCSAVGPAAGAWRLALSASSSWASRAAAGLRTIRADVAIYPAEVFAGRVEGQAARPAYNHVYVLTLYHARCAAELGAPQEV